MVGVKRRYETFCRVQETMNQLGAWLVKDQYREWALRAPEYSASVGRGSKGPRSFELVMGGKDKDRQRQ